MSEKSIYSRENEGIHHLKRVQDSNRKGPGPSSSPMIFQQEWTFSFRGSKGPNLDVP